MPRRRAKKKRAAAGTDDELPVPGDTPPVATGMGELLRRAGLDRASRPPPTLPPPEPPRPSRVPEAPAEPPPPLPKPPLRARHTAGDQAALDQAYRGVRPIRRRGSGRASPGAGQPVEERSDPVARARLDALVSEALRFEVRWDDDGTVRGRREEVSERDLRRLSGPGLSPEATLDLHGATRAEVSGRVSEFARRSLRRGLKWVVIVVGKGLHSEDGRGVLAEATVQALTAGGAAPRVAAFATAHQVHGGRGAIAVELREPV